MRAVSLFTGAGGFDIGFKNAGIDVILATDHWQDAHDTYMANHPDATYICGDINNVEIPSDVDMIFGGPPCQDFSSAGWSKPKDRTTNADCSIYFMGKIKQVRPDWVVMENVPLMINTPYFQFVQRSLRQMGYAITTEVINAIRYHVPQKRRRLFLIAHMHGVDDELHEPLRARWISTTGLTIRSAIPDIDTDYLWFQPPIYSASKTIFSVDEIAPTIIGKHSLQINPSYMPLPNDATNDLRLVRPPTNSECAILQSFPQDYQFCGSSRSQCKQIANAVAPTVAYNIAKAIQWRIKNPINGKRQTVLV